MENSDITQAVSKDVSREIEYPLTLEEFLKTNIPPVEYVIKPVLPEKGKLLISAHQGSCKTFFALNLACAISSGISPYLNEIEIRKKKVLCVLAEGGDSEMKRRLERMVKIREINPQNLVISYEPSLDFLSDEGRTRMLELLSLSEAGVLIIDPIGQIWTGDELKKEEVRKLTAMFDWYIRFYGISVILTHHWKKPNQNSKAGGHMASGSYWWTAWVDGHITLQGNADNLTLSFAKIRSNEGGINYKDLTIRLREEDFWLEFIGKKGEKIGKQQLDELFDSFGSDRVKFSELAKKAENYCCRNTLYGIIKDSSKYGFEDENARPLYVVKK